MSTENKAAKNPDREKLIGALDTIRETLLTKDLESLRSSIVKVDSNLSRRLDAMKKETTEAVDRLVKEMSSRIDELQPKLSESEKRQSEALAELDERTGQAAAEFKRQLQEAQTKSEDRVRTLKKGLEQVLEAKEEALKAELGNLGQGLTGLQLELQQQMEATQRISGLLNNMATVFSTTAPEAQPAPASPVPVAADSAENLDNAIDRVFQADNAPASRKPAKT